MLTMSTTSSPSNPSLSTHPGSLHHLYPMNSTSKHHHPLLPRQHIKSV